MGAIKRNITDISNIKRGAVQMSAVYRGADLIWPSTPTTVTRWLAKGISEHVSSNIKAGQSVWLTSGFDTKFK